MDTKKKNNKNKGKIGVGLVGHPTDYKGDITIALAREYIENCKDGYELRVEEEEIRGKGKKKEKVATKVKYVHKVKLPTLEGLAVHLGVHKDTIQEWKKHEEFSVLIGELLAKQAEALINNGLSGSYNQTIAKVLLVKHGYIDRQDSEQKHKGLPSLAKLLSTTAKRERGEE